MLFSLFYKVQAQATAFPATASFYAKPVLGGLSIHNAIVNQYVRPNGFGIEQLLPPSPSPKKPD